VPARRAFGPDAASLAAAVFPEPGPAITRGGPLGGRQQRLTHLAQFFLPDDGRLVVVMGGHEAPTDVLVVLAHALAWQGDRDLLMVLPPEPAGTVLRLAPWLDVPLRVYAHQVGEAPSPVPIPSRDEVLDDHAKRPRRREQPLDLGPAGQWVAPLVTEVVERHGLVPEHQKGYQAWKDRGQIVLKIEQPRGVTRVVAGVGHSKPGPGRPAPERHDVTGPLRADDQDRLATAVTRAVEDHRTGAGSSDREHQLQADLAADQLSSLGVEAFARELPAWRGPGRPGLVDFLALGAEGELRVVETKVGGEARIALQALEYAIWVTAHRGTILAEQGWSGDSSKPVALDLVLVAHRGAAHDGYLAGVLEALAGDLRVRVLVMDASSVDTVAQLRPDAIWSATHGRRPVLGERWTDRVQHAIQSARATGHRVMYATAEQALLPEATRAYEHLAERRLLHRFALHVRSSQAFALNLFAPLTEDARHRLLSHLGLGDVTSVDAVTFEHSGEGADLLHEGTPRSPHRTQIDVVLSGTRQDGSRVGALIEVKLTETDFSACSAFLNPDNAWRHVCRSPGVFGGDPTSCFQLANHGSGPRRRRYADLLAGHAAEPTPHADDGGCWVRRGRNQPMRNLALATAMVEQHELDAAVWAVCAPRGHLTMQRRTLEALHTLGPTSAVRSTTLPAEEVAAQQPDGGAQLRQRYPFLNDR
jgi:hypothetical protein